MPRIYLLSQKVGTGQGARPDRENSIRPEFSDSLVGSGAPYTWSQQFDQGCYMFVAINTTQAVVDDILSRNANIYLGDTIADARVKLQGVGVKEAQVRGLMLACSTGDRLPKLQEELATRISGGAQRSWADILGDVLNKPGSIDWVEWVRQRAKHWGLNKHDYRKLWTEVIGFSGGAVVASDNFGTVSDCCGWDTAQLAWNFRNQGCTGMTHCITTSLGLGSCGDGAGRSVFQSGACPTFEWTDLCPDEVCQCVYSDYSRSTGGTGWGLLSRYQDAPFACLTTYYTILCASSTLSRISKRQGGSCSIVNCNGCVTPPACGSMRLDTFQCGCCTKIRFRTWTLGCAEPCTWCNDPAVRNDTGLNNTAGDSGYRSGHIISTSRWTSYDCFSVDDKCAGGCPDQEPSLVGGKLVFNSILRRHLVH